MNLEALYSHLPIWLQNTICSVKGLQIQRDRFGDGFPEMLAGAEQRARWSDDRVGAFRDVRLREFVKHCATTVPYYRDLFRREKIDYRDIRTLDDLKILPVMSKEEVKRAGTRLISEAIPAHRRIPAHTSGTTGAGLKFVTTREAIQEQYAVWWRYRRWHGVDMGDWCGYFGGRRVVPIRQTKPPFWRVNRPGRQVLFSAYHMTADNFPYYISELQRRRLRWLHGYPSMIALLASQIVDRVEPTDLGVEVVTIGAENLLEQQSDVIEKAFGVRPRQHYGLAEAVANISQCECGSLHVDEDFAAVEFLGDEAESCRLVGTNLSNPAFPLLRYAPQDVVTPTSKRCPCGRPGRLVAAIDGRQEDYIVLKNGAKLGRLGHVFKNLVNVREAQILQKRPGEIIACIVRGDRYTDNDERILRQSLKNCLGQDTVVHLNYVEQLTRSKTGKLRFVVSELQEGRLMGEPTTIKTNQPN